jgi:excisionase family DNA binding protein
MAELTITEAAAAFGVSPGTVRRRARRGDLPARKDLGGRYLVEVDDDSAEASRSAANGAATAAQASELLHLREELERVRREVSHSDELLDESRQRAARAELESDRLAQQLAAATVRELQRMAQSDLYALAEAELLAEEPAPADLPGPADEDAAAVAPRSKRWWQLWRRSSRQAKE